MNNIQRHAPLITRRDKEGLHGHKGFVIWFTGLPSSGKSTIAHAVEYELYKLRYSTYVLDGDNIRHGLCKDLGFSSHDRAENIRRVAEVCRLFVDAGLIVLTALVSPFEIHRKEAKKIIGEGDVVEIFCKCPVHVCQQRDVKGNYKKAQEGLIRDFTGISSPFEEPSEPSLIIHTDKVSIDEAKEMVLRLVQAMTCSPFFETTKIRI